MTIEGTDDYMKRIGTEYYKPHPDKPGYVVYDKGRSVQEVFAELRHRLESVGYLPDEYFMMDSEWENGRLWPKGERIPNRVIGNNLQNKTKERKP